MYRQFNIQQLYVLPTQLYLCVLCGSENKQRLFPCATLTDQPGRCGTCGEQSGTGKGFSQALHFPPNNDLQSIVVFTSIDRFFLVGGQTVFFRETVSIG